MIVEDLVHRREQKGALGARDAAVRQRDRLRPELLLSRQRGRDRRFDVDHVRDVARRGIGADGLAEDLPLLRRQEIGAQEGGHDRVRFGDDRGPSFLIAGERRAEREGKQQRDDADDAGDGSAVQFLLGARIEHLTGKEAAVGRHEEDGEGDAAKRQNGQLVEDFKHGGPLPEKKAHRRRSEFI